MSKSVLIFTPHPDDESLGAGGYLLKKKSEGYRIIWLILTNINKEYGWTENAIFQRNNEITEVSQFYPFDKTYNLEFEPSGLDKYSVNEIIKPISEIVQIERPEIVILPSANDPHSDHKIVHQVGISVTKNFRNPFIKLILEMEILSESNFGSVESIQPNYFVDISDYLGKKLKILSIYKSEMGEHPFPRSEESVKALAILRGTQLGTKYAEAFRIIKFFEK